MVGLRRRNYSITKGSHAGWHRVHWARPREYPNQSPTTKGVLGEYGGGGLTSEGGAGEAQT